MIGVIGMAIAGIVVTFNLFMLWRLWAPDSFFEFWNMESYLDTGE